MRSARPDETVSQFAKAQEKIVGRFCSNCRTHRGLEGGRTLGVNRSRTRWVCRTCAERYDRAMEARRVPPA